MNHLLKLDPSNTVLLAQKQELLQAAIGDTEKKLEDLEQAQEDTRRMQELLGYKNIPAWIDYWGGDAVHDWPWWRRQLSYVLQFLL